MHHQASECKLFNELYYWLVLGSNLNESLSLINDESFGLSTDFVIAIFEEDKFLLYNTYNPSKSKGGLLITSHLGVWNKSNDLNNVEINKVERWNLQGIRLKIGVFASECKLFNELYYWLVLGSNLNESLSLINDESFGLSTDFVIAIFEEDKFLLYNTYNPSKSKGGLLITSHLGVWNKSNDLNNVEINKVERWNLQGIRLKIGVFTANKPVEMSIKEYLHDYNFRQFDRITRLGYIMWKHLSEMFNFTLDFFESSTWNKSDINGPVIKALLKGDIDASGTANTIKYEQIGILKNMFYFSEYVVRSMGISLLSINALAFLLLFSSDDFYETYLRSVIIHIGAFCQQSTEFSSDSLSGRIAILHILISNLLLYNYYLASAVSNRLSEPIVPINDSLYELGKKDFQYASESIIGFDHYIKSDDSEIKSFYINHWSKIPESQKFVPPENGMNLVSEGGFAYHTLPEVGYPYVERYFDYRKICELQEVNLVKPTQLSIFVHMDSTFFEMLKNGFARLTEVGVRDRLLQQWSTTKPSCRSDILTSDSVKIKEVIPAIVFLLFSMLISLALLTLELMVALYHHQ
ncbi:uncharacterized protein LOC106637821 [Copidosoma floridanum]|uniref:uncharacterized protein LOC106637821 n=1 Tax=Copidosoma floridanum TaxID=29053 RepID=UPI000C6F662D|nr:uncharacterized protein LOC106637821 [Copidosoma floridanum]